MAIRPIVTQQELARRLGVTQVTVSRALSGKSQLAPETRQRVLDLARKLGYRPNGLARRVQEGRYRGMALLGSSARPSYNIWDQEFHMAAGLALSERSWHLTEGWLPAEGLADPIVVDGLLDRMLADAVLIHDVGPQSPAVEAIAAQHRLAAVWVNTGRPQDAVDFDDAEGARAGLAHLLAQGYRRPALLLGGPPSQHDHHSLPERARGFKAGCDAAGIRPWIIHPEGGMQRVEQAAFFRAALHSPDRPDAVLCYGTIMAYQIRLFIAELGLRLGPDLGLITFGKAGDAVFDMPFSVCHLDYASLGREAVAMAWRILETGRRQEQVRIQIPIIRPGASTTRS
jgi:LacI family transcriptional regulator